MSEGGREGGMEGRGEGGMVGRDGEGWSDITYCFTRVCVPCVIRAALYMALRTHLSNCSISVITSAIEMKYFTYLSLKLVRF